MDDRTVKNIVFKQGLLANINTLGTKNDAQLGEPHFTTNTKTQYIFDGTQNIPVAGRAPIVFGTTHYTVLPSDHTVVMDPTGGSLNVTLPGASSVPNMILSIIDRGATNAVSILASTSNAIGFVGGSVLSLTTIDSSHRLQSNGSTLWIIL